MEEKGTLTQKQLDTIFQISIQIHEHSWFKDKNRDQVQEWVSHTLADSLDIYTIPVGMSWGVSVDEQFFEEYWKENSKIDE